MRRSASTTVSTSSSCQPAPPRVSSIATAASVDAVDVVRDRQRHAELAEPRQQVRQLELGDELRAADRARGRDEVHLGAGQRERLGEAERGIGAGLVGDHDAAAERRRVLACACECVAEAEDVAAVGSGDRRAIGTARARAARLPVGAGRHDDRVGPRRDQLVRARLAAEPQRRRPRARALATRSSTARDQRSRVGSQARSRRCPPGSASRSCTITSWPRAAAVAAVRRPAGPAPITTTLPGRRRPGSACRARASARGRWRA